MPRRSGHVPSYRLHKHTGQARIIVGGKHRYLGAYGSPESKEKYARLIAQLGSGPNIAANVNGDELSVAEMLLAYWCFAEQYYVDEERQPTREISSLRDALRPLRELYGHTHACEFGPKDLKIVRDHLIHQNLSRRTINYRVGRMKRVFKWAVAEELIPPSVHHGLQTVSGLRQGRTKARETRPISPVPDEHMYAVLPFVSPQISTMIQVQRLTGMRSGEMVIMRACDIDRSKDIWLYEPSRHKTSWRGLCRIIPLGPRTQELITPFLSRDPLDFLFSPREAEAWRREHRPIHFKQQRKTPIYPSELRARDQAKAQRRRRQPKRPKGLRYTTESYRHAIQYGFLAATKNGVAIPHWHPHQLRHTRATEIRREHGVEAAQVILGHARADVTQIYAERNLKLGVNVARQSG